VEPYRIREGAAPCSRPYVTRLVGALHHLPFDWKPEKRLLVASAEEYVGPPELVFLSPRRRLKPENA